MAESYETSKALQSSSTALRDTILITHANPEDNSVASWLAARLTGAGYRVWVDLRQLRGGTDFWNEIDFQLRNRTIKQIVLISNFIAKSGVQKELAIGDAVGKLLKDPGFMIPIRVSDLPFSDFPPELIRRNAHNAYPNWADALEPILEDLKEAKVPRQVTPDRSFIEQLIASREIGRNVVEQVPETLLTNWFPIAQNIPYLHFFSLQCPDSQKKRWLTSLTVPFIEYGSLVGTFCDPVSFHEAGAFPITLQKRFSISFESLVTGREAFPFKSKTDSRRAAVNLMRQHWDMALRRKGLVSFEYADGKIGWFFPDGLVEGPVRFRIGTNSNRSRILSGKFKERRWHLCLVARPQLFPFPLFRIHANVTLSEDGKTPLPGKATQKIRRRLTKSWWNDKWRDMLIASASWLAENDSGLIDISAGAERFHLVAHPISVDSPYSYRDDSRQILEEGDAGEVILSEELDQMIDEVLTDEGDLT